MRDFVRATFAPGSPAWISVRTLNGSHVEMFLAATSRAATHTWGTGTPAVAPSSRIMCKRWMESQPRGNHHRAYFLAPSTVAQKPMKGPNENAKEHAIRFRHNPARLKHVPTSTHHPSFPGVHDAQRVPVVPDV